jgi:hypothetical protein
MTEATDMTRKERATKLRMELATANRGGAGRPFPEQLRRAVVDYAAEAMAEGESPDNVSRELGVSGMSIKRWTERAGRGAAKREQLRRVEIVADLGAPTVAAMMPGVVVHTRAGLRIEGLTLPALAALVRAVG